MRRVLPNSERGNLHRAENSNEITPLPSLLQLAFVLRLTGLLVLSREGTANAACLEDLNVT